MASSFSRRLAAGLSSKSQHKRKQNNEETQSAENENGSLLVQDPTLTVKFESNLETKGTAPSSAKGTLSSMLTRLDKNTMPPSAAKSLAELKHSRRSTHKDVLAAKSSGIHKTKPAATKRKLEEAGVKVPLKAPHEPCVPTRKDAGSKSRKIALEMKRIPSKVAKRSASNGLKVEHPISLHFKAASESYARHVVETIPCLLANEYANLVGNLSAITASSAAELDELNSLHDDLFFPVEEVELEIKLNKGKPEETTTYETLGTRLEKFTKLFYSSEAKLKALHEKWNQVTEDITNLWIGDEKLQSQALRNTYVSQANSLGSLYHKKVEAAKHTFEDNLREIIDRAAHSEKAFDDRRRQSNKQLLLLLQQEEEADVD